MAEVNLLDRYPVSNRPINARSRLITDAHRATARKFGREFFDGDRLFGYGGYTYHPRFWTDTVKRFKEYYDLGPEARVLDVGCAKGFMMYDFKRLMPDIDIRGVDISPYAHAHAMPEMRPFMRVGDAKELPFEDNSFDLVIAINTLHNLPLAECKQALREVRRVTRKDSFVMNDAWRNEAERQAMLSWNLTGLTYMHVDDWKALFDEVGYRGDYFWFIAA